MNIHLKLYGVFRTVARANELVIEIEEKSTVKSAIGQLVSRKGFENLRQLLLEEGSSDPRPNALIMVSGREINTLKGLETELNDRDEIALLPVAHGG